MFYGWRIVAVSAVSQAVAIGTTFYAYGAFMKPLAEEFGATRLAVTLGMTSMTVVQGLAAPFIGRALDRLSPRFVLAAGVVFEALGLGLLSQAAELWQAGLLLVTAIALGSTLFSTLATTALVGRWFIRLRGRALGLAALGSAAGGIVFPSVVTALIGELGWRRAAGALGAGVLLLVVPILLFVAGRPEDVGALPDGDPAVVSSADTSANSFGNEPANGPLPTRALLVDRNFWAITIAIAFAYSPVNVMLAHLVPFATDIGI
ncbi:MFS transporter, partial [Myxococcota bacterium]|nr:MFS transporter [Myxococcota bacterium]